MDFLSSPAEVASMTSLILLLILNAQTEMARSLRTADEEEEVSSFRLSLSHFMHENTIGEENIYAAVLHHFRLQSTVLSFDEDLGYWVQPRSTTWFTKFLLEEYDDERWIKMFRMTKKAVLSLTELLVPYIDKRNTNYRLCIPLTVRVACTLFKLCHGASLLICSEMFAVGRSSVSHLLRDVVYAISIALKNEIQWPSGEGVPATAAAFAEVCGLPGVLGAVDGTHFSIAKPKVGAHAYYHFKSGGYTMQCQAVVDAKKRFIDVTVGMPGLTNDFRVLRRSYLYHRGDRGILWDRVHVFNGFTPYLLGDSGFPLLPWLMVPHRRTSPLSVAAQLFNQKLSRGRVIVENTFALLKHTFRELLLKCDLHVTFIPDVVVACMILHNVLLKQSHTEVDMLFRVLQSERKAAPAEPTRPLDSEECERQIDSIQEGPASVKREELAVYLSLHSEADP